MPVDYNELTLPQIEHLGTIVNLDQNPVRYLSIDPGKHNGVSGYDDRFYLQFMYTVNYKNMTDFLTQFSRIKVCVVEDFLLYPNKALEQRYSRMETSQVIGGINTWAKLEDVKVITQLAAIKETGYKWLGQKPPSKSNPRNHELDAHCHFTYWAVRNGHINLVDLLKRGIRSDRT